MTCEDCIHYQVCQDYDNRVTLDIYNMAEKCKYFKDKSLIVELPCKVGDKVYAVIRSICFGNHIQEMTIKEFGIYAQTDFAVNTRWPNVFLDKSKAEARLKELNGKE